MMNLKKIALPALFIVSTGLLGGCATNKEALEKVENAAAAASEAAASAKKTADEALSAANAAQQSANQANSKADEALSTARQALSNSESNRSAINELNEKIDRMFKKSMHK